MQNSGFEIVTRPLSLTESVFTFQTYYKKDDYQSRTKHEDK